jgi:hypothetical protein
MKKIFGFVFGLILSAGPLFSQENVSLCEKLFYAYQSSGDELRYARGELSREFPVKENGYQDRDFKIKPAFFENTNFKGGSISVEYLKSGDSPKTVKVSVLKIKTAYLGEIQGVPGDSAFVNQFLRFGGVISNCFTGGTVEQTQLTNIEKYTHAIKYVIYTKNILNEQKLIVDSLCLNNPYIEVSLHRTMAIDNKFSVYIGVKIIHRT